MSSLLCTSDTTAHLLALLLGDLLTLCCFLTSHPLPLAYLLLSSPYLLPLLSFLSPLLISTSLLLLLTLLISSPSAEFPGNTFRVLLGILMAGLESGEPSIGPLVEVAQALLGGDGSGALDWDFENMGELFKSSSLNCKATHNPIELGLVNSEKSKLLGPPFMPGDRGISEEAEAGHKAAEESSETLRLDPPANVGEIPIRSSSRRRKEEHVRRGSEGLGRDGSMRREKEWKRTLACKLYEERVTFKLCEERAVVDGGEEEMDFLWEAYEDDANKTKNGKGKREEEERDAAGQLCCLQALRLSAGRPSILKVSKILKGIGLLRSVSKRGGRKK